MFVVTTRGVAWGALGLLLAGPVAAQTPSATVPAVQQVPVTETAPAQPETVAPPTIVPTPAPVVEPVPPVVPTPEPKPTPKPVKKGPPDSLKPGQFVWENREAYVNPLRMVIVLDIQRMYVFDGDSLVGFTTVSTGKKGKETPTGYFKILQKKIYHESNIYANAPMPFMQRLTWDGIALHAGHNPGYPASHGCIRLPKTFAKSLFDVTAMDGEVVILESLSKPRPKPQPAPVAPVDPVPAVPEQPIQTSPLTTN
ncbi:L,D-transpeptidase family protein [Sphingorhabdus sp.]|uniref:L,D-transpeptidase family protein n=1 Tax=Sphingorhabdus sp. TaxID=1902408 RepID=UPI0032B84C33